LHHLPKNLRIHCLKTFRERGVSEFLSGDLAQVLGLGACGHQLVIDSDQDQIGRFDLGRSAPAGAEGRGDLFDAFGGNHGAKQFTENRDFQRRRRGCVLHPNLEAHPGANRNIFPACDKKNSFNTPISLQALKLVQVLEGVLFFYRMALILFQTNPSCFSFRRNQKPYGMRATPQTSEPIPMAR